MNALLPVARMTAEELCVRVADALRSGRLDAWERGFAASIAKSERRRNWAPTERQISTMRRIVNRLRAPETAGDLIDRNDRWEDAHGIA